MTNAVSAFGCVLIGIGLASPWFDKAGPLATGENPLWQEAVHG
jgi:hypothetical protein